MPVAYRTYPFEQVMCQGMAMGVLVILLVVVAFGGIAYLSWRSAKKRREAFAAFAAQNGWRLVAEDDSWAHRWNGDPFRTGDHRRARNVITGERDGRQIVAFDYSYQTHSTDSQGRRQTQTHRFGVCAVSLAGTLPSLQVTSEGIFAKIGHALGFDDIEFESEDFNRKFRVTSDDRKFAYDVVHPRMMEYLLGAGSVAWRLEADTIYCWDGGRHKPAEVAARLEFLDGIGDRIPDFVWSDRGILPPATSTQEA
jgi:hypothetical protein